MDADKRGSDSWLIKLLSEFSEPKKIRVYPRLYALWVHPWFLFLIEIQPLQQLPKQAT